MLFRGNPCMSPGTFSPDLLLSNRRNTVRCTHHVSRNLTLGNSIEPRGAHLRIELRYLVCPANVAKDEISAGAQQSGSFPSEIRRGWIRVRLLTLITASADAHRIRRGALGGETHPSDGPARVATEAGFDDGSQALGTGVVFQAHLRRRISTRYVDVCSYLPFRRREFGARGVPGDGGARGQSSLIKITSLTDTNCSPRLRF